MSKIKILSDKDIQKIIDLDIAACAVCDAYKQKSAGKGSVWPIVFYEYEHDVFDLDIRSGNLYDSNTYGLKLISYNENNPNLGYSKLMATALIFDDKTGQPLAMLNAAPITSYRTGAAAAIGAKYLARKDSKNLLIVGTGNVARYSAAATLLLMPKIENVYIYHALRKIDKGELLSFKEEVEKLLVAAKGTLSANFYVADDISEVTSISDIIITATPSAKAIIDDRWVKEGTHFSCMGAGLVGKQEIDEKILARARIFADDEKLCLEQGEAQCSYNRGIISGFTGEIGDVILGKIEGRKTDADITIFDSVGLFLQDLATSMELLKVANEKSIGMEVEL